MASGSPSSCATIPTMARALSPVSAKSGRAQRARSTKSWTASAFASSPTSGAAVATGSVSGGTGYSCSPLMRSTMRVVTITLTREHSRRISATSRAAPTTCSKLSMTRSARFWRSWSTRCWSGVRAAGTTRPRVCAICDATRSGSVTAASRTNQTPSSNSVITCAASSRLRRDFPVPPGPMSVRRRVRSRSARASASSWRRPMNEVICTGRLFGAAESVRGIGKSFGRPSITSWKRRSGCGSPLSRCSPRSRSVTPAGSSSPKSVRVADEIRTWPPCPAAEIRAARTTSLPM